MEEAPAAMSRRDVLAAASRLGGSLALPIAGSHLCGSVALPMGEAHLCGSIALPMAEPRLGEGVTLPQTGAHCLMVDDAFIDSASGVRRVLHPLRQHAGNPVMVQDRPWECRKDFVYYPGICMWSDTVLRDPTTGRFRMWYGAYVDRDEQGRDTGLLLYAESEDGVRWVKPSLGIVEWHGSKDNNIVLTGVIDGVPGHGRLLDTANVIYRPWMKDPMDRYLLLVAMYTAADAIEGVWVYRSADGLRWVLAKEDAIANAREFNSFFWDPVQRKYIGTVRIRRPVLPRHVGYTESADGLTWKPAEVLVAPKDLNTPHNLPGDDAYGMCSFRYESHCLGFLHAHHADRRLEVQLMSSRDGRTWGFVADGAYILPNDPPGGYGQGMMSTQNGPPIRMGDELWFYIGLSPVAHRETRLQPAPGQQKRVVGLAKLRLDGFASMEAGGEPGTLTTTPFEAAGGRLYVNAKADRGWLKAEALGEDGGPLAGLTGDRCAPVTVDKTRAEVRWRGKRLPAGKQIRLRFTLTNAGLYSFWTE